MNKFLKAHKTLTIVMEHSDNEHVEGEDEVTDDKGCEDEIAMVMMITMMISMIKTDEHHAPSITMT